MSGRLEEARLVYAEIRAASALPPDPGAGPAPARSPGKGIARTVARSAALTLLGFAAAAIPLHLLLQRELRDAPEDVRSQGWPIRLMHVLFAKYVIPRIDVKGLENLPPGSYLVAANHAYKKGWMGFAQQIPIQADLLGNRRFCPKKSVENQVEGVVKEKAYVSEQEIPNWVERRWRGEKILAESKLGLWREICDALDASAKSFNNRYKGTSEVTRIDGHLVRIVLPTPNRVQIDIAFNDLACSVAAALSYDTPKLHFRNFKIAADHVSAFIADEHGDRLTPDQVSERILSPSFFAQG